ncbi:MAG: hypothetical protein H6591_01565 [Flavobacteriales bacterium]|nr:hypothetical protein [Flavobacteriales bacterium]
MVIAADPAADAELARLIGLKCQTARILHELQGTLLFCAAYPCSDALARAAARGIESLDAHARALAGGSARYAEKVADSGLPGSTTTGCYSLDLVRWLVSGFPDAVALHSIDAPLEEFLGLLRPVLPRAAQEFTELPHDNAVGFLAALFGDDGGAQIRGLLSLLESATLTDAAREALYNGMQVYIEVRCGGSIPGLAHLRGPAHPPGLHRQGIERRVALAELMAEPINAPLRLSRGQENELVGQARLVLAVMQRETDPVTYAGAPECFDMGRGLRIALFHIDPSRRLVLDSYVGFMAFKNGIPMAYGGAWVFPGKTKVGINIFPHARGGESAWFFAQLLRLYAQRFGVVRFEAENYQLGHGNADGLKSGAYWFYYRLGFRPWNDELAAIAAHEADRLAHDRSYAVPMRVLKRLVADGLQLRTGALTGTSIDTGALLHAVMGLVRGKHGGDALGAPEYTLRAARAALGGRWAGAELEALRTWALPLDLIPGWKSWPRRELDRIARIIRAKAARTETEHQRLLAGHTRLLEAWSEALGDR